MAHLRSEALHSQQEVAIFISRSCDPPHPGSDLRMFSAHAHSNIDLCQMASSETAEPIAKGSGEITKIQTACEYQALKDCLEKNNWRKEKCEKEWREFENLCSRNRE